MKRVVLTGGGTINAVGGSESETLQATREWESGIWPLKMRDLDRLSVNIGGQIKDFDPEAHFDRQKLALYDRVTQLVLLASREAMAQSGLEITEELSETTGVVLGTAAGGMNTWDDNFRSVYEEGKNRVHPFVVPKLMTNAAASHLSMAHNIKGPSLTVSTACASSNHAIGLAFHMVRSGMAQVMLAGGGDAMLTFGGIKAWEGLRVMSKTACRPFSANRSGMVQGEGAGVFVLETYEGAKARGAEILAELIGFSMTSDAGDIVMPNQQGAVRAIRGALRDACLDPQDIGYINAHGTGTAANDKTECAAVTEAFGAHAPALMMSSTKSMHGHLIGGTGAVELLACLMALRDGVIAPTIGYEQPDPNCALDVVPNVARQAKVTATLSNAFAFGGMNAVLALKAI